MSTRQVSASTRQIPVTLTWDDAAKDWIATASSPFLVARGSTIEYALTYLRRALAEKLEGKNFELDEKIELPAKLQELLAETERATAQLKALTEQVPRLRMKVLDLVTGELRMNQAHAAKFLGLTSSYLTKIAGKVSLQMTQETTQALKNKNKVKRTSTQ